MATESFSLATRGSDLALYQTRLIASLLLMHGYTTREHMIKTRGDKDYRPFTEFTGDGFFTKELEYALLKDEADFAVHSSKDLPSMIHQSLPWRAVHERANSGDILLFKKGSLTLSRSGPQFKKGARIGTSSPRRLAQAQIQFPGTEISNLRGNVPTRARKVLSGDYDAVILARAGLDRLGLIKTLGNEGIDFFDLDWITAPCQGILGVQTRSELLPILDLISNRDLHQIAMAEKTILALLGGGCHLPVGCRFENTTHGYRLHFFFSEKSETHRYTIDGARLGDVLRTLLNRLSHAPLTGPRVWLTNPVQHQLKPARLLAQAGLAVGSWPLVEVVPSWQIDQFQEVRDQWSDFGAIAFASQFSVQLFEKEFLSMWMDRDKLKNIPIYAVGASTRDALEDLNLVVQKLPDQATAEDLANEMSKKVNTWTSRRVLIPGTEKTRVRKALKKHDIDVRTLELYNSRPSLSPLSVDFPQFSDQDIIVFTSPSAADVFALHATAVPELKKIKCAAIGPSTANALRDRGFDPIVSPQSGNWEQLVDRLKRK